MKIITFVAIVMLTVLAGCGESSDTSTPKDTGTPSFMLAWSEWPGWSTFYVAHQLGEIDGAAGKMGKLERKHGVDIVLKELDYDPCITGFSNGSLDAACLTNMDSLPASLNTDVVAFLINDTSFGGDCWLTTDSGLTWDSIKNATQPLEVYGLENSVSHYLFVRLCELHNIPEGKVKFINLDPGQAAIAMQQGQRSNIIVWNPFVLQTLKNQTKARIFASSKEIPNEIMDLVVTSQKVLYRKGGKDFAACICDAYYVVMRRLVDPATKDDTLRMIGEKFSRLPIEEMRKIEEGTAYIHTSEAGVEFFTSPSAKATMERVLDFGVTYLKLSPRPTVSFGEGKANFRFDPSFMRASL